jgi:hypothetical protein
MNGLGAGLILVRGLLLLFGYEVTTRVGDDTEPGLVLGEDFRAEVRRMDDDPLVFGPTG